MEINWINTPPQDQLLDLEQKIMHDRVVIESMVGKGELVSHCIFLTEDDEGPQLVMSKRGQVVDVEYHEENKWIVVK